MCEMKKTYKEKAHQMAGLNFFDLVTFTKREEASPSITLQIYGNFNKNDTQVCIFFTCATMNYFNN